jgi:hypothetical protein
LHTPPRACFAQVIFRNVHQLLLDTASAEFLFCLDWWGDEGVWRELAPPVVGAVEGDLAQQLQVRSRAHVWAHVRLHLCVCVGGWGWGAGGRGACRQQA